MDRIDSSRAKSLSQPSPVSLVLDHPLDGFLNAANTRLVDNPSRKQKSELELYWEAQLYFMPQCREPSTSPEIAPPSSPVVMKGIRRKKATSVRKETSSPTTKKRRIYSGDAVDCNRQSPRGDHARYITSSSLWMTGLFRQFKTRKPSRRLYSRKPM